MNTLGVRLQQARKAAGLSLRALADLVSLSHAAIKKYEDGEVYPSSDILIKLAKALKVRVDFFFRPVFISLKNLKFRKQKKLSSKAEELIKLEVINQIERRLELENLYPRSSIPLFEFPHDLPQKINNFEELELITEKIRNDWKLGLAPIPDLVNAFEDHGIKVFIIDTDEKYFEGLSTVVSNQPIVVISSKCPGDRQRFNLIHEFAHIILNDRLSSKLDEEEACNRFASSFLFPREAIFQVVGKKRQTIDWQELFFLKEQFLMSIESICSRLKEVKVIQNSYYKNLINRFRQKKWHQNEPGEIPPEKARTFNQMLFHALNEKYIGESKASELLSCSLVQLKALRLVQQNAFTHQRCEHSHRHHRRQFESDCFPTSLRDRGS